MARFVYRLQKVFELRERRKKKQEQAVIDATAALNAVKARIEAKKAEIRKLQENMLTAPHTLMAAHDEFIKLLYEDLERLYQELEQAKERLAHEKQLLIKAQADLEALVKHKEKAHELWIEEEKQLEMKKLDEIAGQRYFRNQQEELLANALEEAALTEFEMELESDYATLETQQETST